MTKLVLVAALLAPLVAAAAEPRLQTRPTDRLAQRLFAGPATRAERLSADEAGARAARLQAMTERLERALREGARR